MAYELVEEVLDHAPQILDAAEVLLLTVIAEQIRGRGRQVDISQEVLLRRLRVSESGLRKIFRRLASNGLDVRVPMRHSIGGKPVYAMIGRTCTFRLPDLKPPQGCDCRRCREEVPQSLLRKEEVLQGAHLGPQGKTTALAGADSGPQDPPPIPSLRYGGVRGHASTARSDGGQEHDPFPSTTEEQKQWARRRLKEGSDKHRINGHNHLNAFGALLSVGVEPEEQT